MIPRFFVEELPESGQFSLGEAETRHLRLARRVKLGERIALFDGRSHFAREATVVSPGSRQAMLELTGRILEGTCEPLRHLTLAICIPKGERFDWLIEKSVEVGVSQLIPLQTERSVVQPRAAKLDRQRRAVIEASKQCGRNRLMSIASPRSWAELIAHEAAPLRAVGRRDGNPCSEISECRSLEPAILAIGPEGGLTEAELELAFANGWRSLTLARTVLRVETAAIVGSALILNASQS